jgi:hypothetical protein
MVCTDSKRTEYVFVQSCGGSARAGRLTTATGIPLCEHGGLPASFAKHLPRGTWGLGAVSQKYELAQTGATSTGSSKLLNIDSEWHGLRLLLWILPNSDRSLGLLPRFPK